MKFLASILVLLGLIVSAYLLSRSFSLGDPSTPKADVCSAVFGAGCDATLESPLARQLGIPLAGWGVVYYATLLSLLTMGWLLGPAFEFESRVAAFLFSLFGAGLGLLLAATMLLHVVPFCPLCCVLQVNGLLLALVLGISVLWSPHRFFTAIASAARFVVGAKSAEHTAAPWKTVGLVACSMVGVILYQWIMVAETQRDLAAASQRDLGRVLEAYKAQPVAKIPIGESDAHLGDLKCPVQLVVFSDLRCSSCRRFAATLQHLKSELGEDLLIVFKHFPLEGRCNQSVPGDLHPGACQAAWQAEAAQLQGKFWEYHDATFSVDQPAGANALPMAERIDLDVRRLDEDSESEAVRGKVTRDVQLGVQLGVKATPTVFLNGRRVDRPDFDALVFLAYRERASLR
jgi:protein-disulfide isomerase